MLLEDISPDDESVLDLLIELPLIEPLIPDSAFDAVAERRKVGGLPLRDASKLIFTYLNQ